MKKQKKKNVSKKKVVPKKKNKPKIKLNYKKVFTFLLFLCILIFLFTVLINKNIRNIVVVGNTILTDQRVIEIAGIDKYPSYFGTSKKKMINKLKENVYVDNVTIIKKNFSVKIIISENHPLFYNTGQNKTVLLNGNMINGKVNAPNLINYIPDNVYDSFLRSMQKVDLNIIKRISEIQYKPNEVDDSRFFLFMNDGNYVYLTISKFDVINDYEGIMENIIAKFGNQNGILNLDSGGYFDLLD